MSGRPDADEQPAEVRDKQDEQDSTTTAFDQVGSAANGNYVHSVLDQNKLLLPSESSDLISDGVLTEVNLRSEQLSTAGDEASAHTQTEDTSDKEKNEATQPPQISINPVQTTTQFAANPVELQVTDAGDTPIVEDETKAQSESLSPPTAECETQGGHRQEAEDRVVTTKENREAQISSEGGNERLEAAFESNVKPKEDSLVEVSFDDVPEAQQIKEFREKQLEEQTSHTDISEVQAEEKPDQVAASEYRMVGVEKDVCSDGQRNQNEAPVMTESSAGNDCNSSDVDEIVGEGVASLRSSPQPCDEANAEEPGKDITQLKIDNIVSEVDFEQEEHHTTNTEGAETLANGKDTIHEEHNQEIGGSEESNQQIVNESVVAESLSTIGQEKEDTRPHEKTGDGDDEEEEQKEKEEDGKDQDKTNVDVNDLEEEHSNVPASEGADTLDCVEQCKDDTWTASKEEHDQETGGNFSSGGGDDDDDFQQENKNISVSAEVETFDSVRQDNEYVSAPSKEKHHKEIGGSGDGKDDEDNDGLHQKIKNIPVSPEERTVDSVCQGKEDITESNNAEHHQEIVPTTADEDEDDDHKNDKDDDDDHKNDEDEDDHNDDEDENHDDDEDGDCGGGDDDKLQQDRIIIPASKEVETADPVRQGKEETPAPLKEPHLQEIVGSDGGDADPQQENKIIPEEVNTVDAVRQGKEDIPAPNNEDHHKEIGGGDDDHKDLELTNAIIISSEETAPLNTFGQGKEDTRPASGDEHYQMRGDGDDSNSTIPDPEAAKTVNPIGQSAEGIAPAENEDCHQDIGGDDGGSDLEKMCATIPNPEEVQTLDCVLQSIETLQTDNKGEHQLDTRNQEICGEDDGCVLEQGHTLVSEEGETLNAVGQGKEDIGVANDMKHHQEICGDGGGGGDLEQGNPLIPEESKTLNSVGHVKEDTGIASNEQHQQGIRGDDGGGDLEPGNLLISEEGETLNAAGHVREDIGTANDMKHHQEMCGDTSSDDLGQENPIHSGEGVTLNSGGQLEEAIAKANDEQHHQEVGDHKVTRQQSLQTVGEVGSATLGAHARGLPEQSEGTRGPADEAQADTGNDRGPASKEGTSEAPDPKDDGAADSEIQETADAMSGQGRVNSSQVADQPANHSREEGRPQPTCEASATAQLGGSGHDEVMNAVASRLGSLCLVSRCSGDVGGC